MCFCVESTTRRLNLCKRGAAAATYSPLQISFESQHNNLFEYFTFNKNRSMLQFKRPKSQSNGSITTAASITNVKKTEKAQNLLFRSRDGRSVDEKFMSSLSLPFQSISPQNDYLSRVKNQFCYRVCVGQKGFR